MCFSRNSTLKNNLLWTLKNILNPKKKKPDKTFIKKNSKGGILKEYRQKHDIININTNPVR